MSVTTSDVILERMMALHPKIIDLTLDRMWRLLDALGNPQDDLPPVIHIAGTNGKGSTQAMIRAGLETAGHSVHAYTSPHLARFHERIRVAGKLISEADLTAVLDECYAANGGEDITYFEITTCAALLAFSRVPADFTLLEVGLGGRLDATNVIARPKITAITPVSIDHQQFLGDTIDKIAFEKAGIIKRGVPCVVARQEEEGLAVIEDVAERASAPLVAYGQHWHVGPDRDRMTYQDDTGLLDLSRPNLPGEHQMMNAGTAIAVLRHLGFGSEVSEAAVSRAEWPARMQRLGTGFCTKAAPRAEIWLDGGHNPAAGQALAAHLRSLPKRPTYLICGMLNTKDIDGYLRPMAEISDGLIAISIPDEVNTLPANLTAEAARRAGFDAHTASNVQNALSDIATHTPEARILICGSLYLAGSVLRAD
ncbi:MAG: folylpolyglutamate synthase/dihydrofolate synthase family protein [Paracoccaceae bacterium]|nr:folylpolyglutamate synthase/dihydrofolate synthase family protein [Paracoccaceae bacterium]